MRQARRRHRVRIFHEGMSQSESEWFLQWIQRGEIILPHPQTVLVSEDFRPGRQAETKNVPPPAPNHGSENQEVQASRFLDEMIGARSRTTP